MLAGEVERLALPGAAQDREELVGAGVALVLVRWSPKRRLLDRVAAGDDVEQQPAAGEPLVRRGHLRGERRRDQARPERDQELQALGLLGQRRRGEPGVLAPRAGGRERRPRSRAARRRGRPGRGSRCPAGAGVPGRARWWRRDAARRSRARRRRWAGTSAASVIDELRRASKRRSMKSAKSARPGMTPASENASASSARRDDDVVDAGPVGTRRRSDRDGGRPAAAARSAADHACAHWAWCVGGPGVAAYSRARSRGSPRLAHRVGGRVAREATLNEYRAVPPVARVRAPVWPGPARCRGPRRPRRRPGPAERGVRVGGGEEREVDVVEREPGLLQGVEQQAVRRAALGHARSSCPCAAGRRRWSAPLGTSGAVVTTVAPATRRRAESGSGGGGEDRRRVAGSPTSIAPARAASSSGGPEVNSTTGACRDVRRARPRPGAATATRPSGRRRAG